MNKQVTNQLKELHLTCIECGSSFIFSPGEQEFFKSKGLSTPKRCKACRDRRRASLVPDKRGA